MAKIVDMNKYSAMQAKKRSLVPWLLLVAAVLAALLMLLQNTIRIKEIIVVGNEHYSSEEIIQMTGIQEGENILQVYFNGQDRLINHPYLEKADVVFVSYNQIKIEVVEKEVVAGYRFSGKYLCIDKDGYIIDYADDLPDGVPLLEGVDIDSFAAGQPLDVEPELLDAILTLYQLQNKFDLTLDTIDLRYGGVSDILLLHGNLSLYLGSAERLERKMEKASQIIGKIDPKTVGYVDLTDPDGRVILKKFQGN